MGSILVLESSLTKVRGTFLLSKVDQHLVSQASQLKALNALNGVLNLVNNYEVDGNKSFCRKAISSSDSGLVTMLVLMAVYKTLLLNQHSAILGTSEIGQLYQGPKFKCNDVGLSKIIINSPTSKLYKLESSGHVLSKSYLSNMEQESKSEIWTRG